MAQKKKDKKESKSSSVKIEGMDSIVKYLDEVYIVATETSVARRNSIRKHSEKSAAE